MTECRTSIRTPSASSGASPGPGSRARRFLGAWAGARKRLRLFPVDWPSVDRDSRGKVARCIMGRLIISRLLQMVPLLFGITFLTFAIINFVPGSPVSRLEFNPKSRPEDRERIANNLGLNEPVYERYFTWLGNVLQGDLGISLINFTPVRARILN